MLFDEHTWGAHNSIKRAGGGIGPRPMGPEIRRSLTTPGKSPATVRDRSLAVLTRNITTGRRLAPGRFQSVVLDPDGRGPDRPSAPPGRAEGTIPPDREENRRGNFLPDRRTQYPDVPGERCPFDRLRRLHGRPRRQAVAARFRSRSSRRIGSRTASSGSRRMPTTGGLRSVIDKETGRELVDPASPYHARTSSFTKTPKAAGRPSTTWRSGRPSSGISPGSGSRRPRACRGRSPRASSSLRKPSAIPEIRQEVVLYDGLKRIDIVNRLRKEETFEPEAAYFAFPFTVEGGRFRFEIAGAAMAPEIDQLPGTTRDWLTVQNWVEAAGPKGSVVWSPIEAPARPIRRHQHGEMAEPSLDFPNQTVFSYVFNNLWMTNFKAGQGGPLVFRYAFTSRPGGADPVASTRFGAEARTPFVADWLPKNFKGTSARNRPELLCRRQPNVLIQTVTTAESGGGDRRPAPGDRRARNPGPDFLGLVHRRNADLRGDGHRGKSGQYLRSRPPVDLRRSQAVPDRYG